MQALNNRLLLTKDDHKLLLSYLHGAKDKKTFDRRNAEELQYELKRAKLVKKEDFPGDVVRINSTVRVKMEGKNDVMELTLVTPDKADIKERKISVLAPIGTALLGFRKGQRVQWQVPAGKRTFEILEVKNE
jgi:regulator of nucleoside diphosphate kinase